MAAFSDKFERSVIPRWHDSLAHSFNHEAQSLKAVVRPFAPDTSEIRQELLATGTLAVAVDALNVAVAASDNEMALLAAEIIQTRGAGLPSPVVATARKVLGLGQHELPILQPFQHIHQQRIAELRAVLRAYPRSPLVHLNLARHQLTLGQIEKAGRSVATALTLNPQNRTILRVAARFYVSIGEKERAYHLIRHAQATKLDPWLLAAEIALSQMMGKEPHHWRVGKDFLARAAFAPLHLSELASAAGTKEMLAGNTKGAKKLFRQGLQAPTENALAQARWAEGRIGTGLVETSTTPFDGSEAFEAEFFRFYQQGRMQEAVECGKHWFYEEPFSSTAASAAVHVAGLLDDYEAVETFARLGLSGHHHNANLRNNILYAQISSGKLLSGNPQTVEHAVNRTIRELRIYVEAGGLDGVHAMANLGLLAFRIGSPEDGRTIYERTIEVAQKAGEAQPAATAAVFFARESILAGVSWAAEALERARTLCKPLVTATSPTPSLTFYLKKVEALAKNPEDSEFILSGQSARNFAAPRHPVKLRVTRKDDRGLIVWVPPQR